MADQYERESTATTNRGSTSRNAIPSMCETEFEDEIEDDWVSTYSGEDVQLQEAKASSLVQVRFRNTIDSIMSLYSEDGEVY